FVRPMRPPRRCDAGRSAGGGDKQWRAHFTWLFLSAPLFIAGASSLAKAHLFSCAGWPIWLTHLVPAAAMAVMASNVAAYSVPVGGQVMRVFLKEQIFGGRHGCVTRSQPAYLLKSGHLAHNERPSQKATRQWGE